MKSETIYISVIVMLGNPKTVAHLNQRLMQPG